MENTNGIHDEDYCPECECNIIEARNEAKKKQLFETRYGEELIFIRKRAKPKRMLVGAVILMLFPLLIFSLVPAFERGLFIREYNYLPSITITIVYGLVGAWWGTMYKGPSREEKRLWKNFK